MLNEEKIKAFFNDEEKVKEFMNDEEFINKVSECQATPEIYVEKFKKFGIELSEEEAKAVQETVDKIMEKPVEKLDETELKDIAGGVTGGQVAAGIALTAAGAVAASELVGAGCLIAGRIYEAKAERAYNKGKYSKAEKYSNKCSSCIKAGTGFVTLGIEPMLNRYENGD